MRHTQCRLARLGQDYRDLYGLFDENIVIIYIIGCFKVIYNMNHSVRSDNISLSLGCMQEKEI